MMHWTKSTVREKNPLKKTFQSAIANNTSSLTELTFFVSGWIVLICARNLSQSRNNSVKKAALEQFLPLKSVNFARNSQIIVWNRVKKCSACTKVSSSVKLFLIQKISSLRPFVDWCIGQKASYVEKNAKKVWWKHSFFKWQILWGQFEELEEIA